ncbi:hypothetical protein DF3PA_230047 [Candidatus Defluviicoccus seviourii]|uniref:Uncharacterized protein n=2 Tax=root TaxID=1 RepID=A0A564WDK1_9PROT|nr:hypothetical protein DF3PB_560008 [uncultured Defluviicoccus sp.]VUX46545.1 hypothetical protein DF3PA_230047 [Candidatus Defluviicoccus seviourii]
MHGRVLLQPRTLRVPPETAMRLRVAAGLAGLLRPLGLPLNEELSNKTRKILSMTQRVP